MKTMGTAMHAAREPTKLLRSASDLSSAGSSLDDKRALTCAPSSRSYAQINVQLYEDLRDIGYADHDLSRVKEAYRVAQRLFAAQFRGSGRPFLAHLVGTASILAKHGAKPDIVIAGLLHAAYELGDFGPGSNGITPAKRRDLSRQVGNAVESLVAQYSVLAWTPERISDYAQRAKVLSQEEHDVLFTRLANELEDGLKDNFRYSGPGKKRSVERCLHPSIALADTLGLTGLAEELQACCEAARTSSTERPLQTERNASYCLVPASYRIRTLP